jgi:hypothetical protein
LVHTHTVQYDLYTPNRARILKHFEMTAGLKV